MYEIELQRTPGIYCLNCSDFFLVKLVFLLVRKQQQQIYS